jgi:hypothetical protein
MHLLSLQIRNYKCFNEPQKLDLTPGFNIITGVNNAGKTALLEAASLRFDPAPHRSLKTIPTEDSYYPPDSSVDVSFAVRKDELRQILQPKTRYKIPLPRETTHPGSDDFGKLLEWFMSREELTFLIRAIEKGTIPNLRSLRSPSFGLYDSRRENGRIVMAEFEVMPDNTHRILGSSSLLGDEDLGTQFLAPALAKRIYAFRAERFNVGVSGVGNNPILHPSAANLPEVLNILKGNPAKFQELNDRLREVLPQIRAISLVPHRHNANQVEILVWTLDPSCGRVDLAFPLNECGTGVGQVLAILYVVLYSETPRVLIIDEPQSFLHPGAVAKLIEVLKQHSQHQYILATHTAAVVAQANPRTLTMLKVVGSETTLETLDPKKISDLRVYMAEMGASLGDVFGADNVLWVEGATEEFCFPMLLEFVAKESLRGTVIVGVKNTGDFNGRHRRVVVDIHRRISGSGSLVPPAVGFLFDDDGKSEQEKKELQSESGNSITFTKRRMYESYLLNPEAIAAVANSIEGFRDVPLTGDEVKKWLEERENRDNTPSGSEDRPGRPWIERVRANSVLENLFSTLSEKRVVYRKPEHSIKLTQWLIEHNPESLREIADIVAESIRKGRERIGQ